MRNTSVAHAVFAATMIAVGVMGLIKGDFAPVWQPVPKGLPAREVLAYLCAMIAFTCGISLLWQRSAAAAARLLFAFLLLWLLLFKVRVILLHPAMEVVYESAGETAVITAGAWVLYARLAASRGQGPFAFAVGDRGLRLARCLYGLAMIAFGLSHFAYLKDTAGLVPGWLPAHTAWAYFTGGAYLAAGVAILLGVYARLAASLSALQMGVFTAVVWLPFIVTGPDASQWSEFVVSWAMTAGGFLVADSYRGVPWLAARRPAPSRA